MSAKNGFETALLSHIFNNDDIANIGDANGLLGSSTAGSFWVALYTTAPSDSDEGTECDYTGYLRVEVARSAGGWTVSGGQVSNTAAVTFPQCTAGDTDIAQWFTINTGSDPDPSEDDAILWGSLSASMTIDVGATPEFAIGALVITCD
jgi:hypothetical protein